MTDLIRALALWARLLFGPRTGSAHRARPAVRAPRPAPVQARPPVPSRAPAPRSPYGLDVPLDGTETALIRPYLRAHEQQQRRLALVLAADFGIDLDTHLVGARAVA